MDEANNRSREALGKFLDYLGDKGLMPKATAQTRKASALKILSILDDVEAADVTTLDIDGVVSRFGHLHAKEYAPGSLASYSSRLHAAMEDFKSHLSNPLAFRPKAHRARTRSDKGAATGPSPRPVEPARPVPPPPMASSNILPIPIRPDLTIFVQGLPYDLSKPEAQKIANVILAMA